MTPTWQTDDGAVRLYCGCALDILRQLPTDSVNLVCGSPPYLFARTYGFKGPQWWDAYETWIETMLAMVAEAARVCIGPVVVVAANSTRKRSYYPAVEALMVRWFERGGECQLYRPVYWHRVSIPGSGQSDGFRADVEYCCVFKRPGKLPWSDNTACGWSPRYAPGGEMSHRKVDGGRVNQWGYCSGCQARTRTGGRTKKFRPSHRAAGKLHTKRAAEGEMEIQNYQPPVLANPGNFIETHSVAHVNVGGGLLGSALAHENEAPYPEALCERFIRSWCPEGGVVLDPWCGSGTTLAVALRWGRKAIGIDLRESQVELTKRRIGAELAKQPLLA